MLLLGTKVVPRSGGVLTGVVVYSPGSPCIGTAPERERRIHAGRLNDRMSEERDVAESVLRRLPYAEGPVIGGYGLRLRHASTRVSPEAQGTLPQAAAVYAPLMH